MRKKLMTIFLLGFASSINAQTIPKSPVDSNTVLNNQKVDTTVDEIPIVSLDGGDDQSDGSLQPISSSGKGWDAFTRAAVFNFNPVRFRIRGYNSGNFTTYMNGVPMEDLTSSYSLAGLWGGLGDETRNRYTTLGMHNNPFAFGDIGSSTFIDTRASKQRSQTSISFGRTDSYVKDATSITHTTGMNKKGWAFTFSGNRRYAENGYVPGTYFDGWGYFFGVDKKIGTKQLLSLVVFGSPSEAGMQGHATKETFALAGSNYYNPDWGYQDGKVRNSRVRKSNQPVGILTHEFTISKRTSLLTAVSYTFGDKSSSRIDYFDVPNPAPDYYSSLPSYYAAIGYPGLDTTVANYLRNNKDALQIDWQNIYNVNRNSYATVNNVDGIAGNSVSGRRSLYVLGESVTNTKKFNFNTTLNTLLTKNITLTAGLTYQLQKNNYYKRIADLLGGDFYVDADQYAEQDFPNNPDASQNDLNHPNRVLYLGDKYGYNYDIDVNNASGWAQGALHLKKADFFVAGELSNTSFWRVGNYKNGLFPNSSFGKSDVNDFTNYAVKFGGSYQLDRTNYLYINAAYLTKAPYFNDSYLDAEIRNNTQSNLRSQDIKTIEGGYVLNSPTLNMRITGYYSTFDHGFNVFQYFNYTYNEFVDYASSNISTVQYGGELGADAKLTRSLTLNAMASVGRYYYNSEQLVTVTQDNSNASLPGLPPNSVVYMQNYRVPNTPQEVYSLGLNYRSRHYWYAELTGNYMDQMWVDPLPDRRTANAVQGYDPGNKLYQNIIDQEKFAGEFLLNLRAGHSWKLKNVAGIKKPLFLSISAGANNLLNNQNIVSNGYEGGRDNKFEQTTGVFDTKYTYAQGRNYFIKATLRFY